MTDDTENNAPIPSTWKNLPLETRIQFATDTFQELTLLRDRSQEIAVRKSNSLTIINGSGLISVLAYLGATKPDLNNYILATLCLFFLGLIANGYAMFKTEKRFGCIKEYFQKLRQDYMNFDGEMTFEEFNERNDDNYKDCTKNCCDENSLELISFILFISGAITSIFGIINTI